MGGTYNQDFAPWLTASRRGGRRRSQRSCRRSTTPGARHFVFSPATAGSDPQPVIDRLFGDVVPALLRVRGGEPPDQTGSSIVEALAITSSASSARNTPVSTRRSVATRYLANHAAWSG